MADLTQTIAEAHHIATLKVTFETLAVRAYTRRAPETQMGEAVQKMLSRLPTIIPTERPMWIERRRGETTYCFQLELPQEQLAEVPDIVQMARQLLETLPVRSIEGLWTRTESFTVQAPIAQLAEEAERV